MKRLVSILLSVLLTLALIGCAAAPGSSPAAQSAPTEAPAAAKPVETEAPAATEAPAETEAPAAAEAPAEPAASPLVGNWLYYSQEGFNGGSTVTHEEVEQYRAQGYGAMVDMILSIYEDGTCKLLWLGELSEGPWTDNGDGTGSVTLEGKTLTLSVEDGMLLSRADDNLSRFERTDRAAA